MDQEAPPQRDIATGAKVAPVPAWVDLEPYDTPASANPHFIANGICVLLSDSQIDLCGPERAWFYRRADLVTAMAGAEQAAQFSVTFDPAFEHVEVHGIAVIRDGKRTEYALTAFFEVLRRERNMERLVFDGRVTIHATLPDVRAGDVVETMYSLHGGRKSLSGRHSAFLGLDWAVGIVDVRMRQRCPETRRIHERTYNGAPEGTQTITNGIIDRRWRTFERQGMRHEPLAPPWVIQGAALQLSEWNDWGEAAAAFTPLYEDTGPLPAAVEAEIARIGAAETTASGRAAAILRFTQNDVRYLAISIGEGGYTPRALAEIDQTRYGDCKDKSKLFTQMARRLGLDACPALVNTRDGYALPDFLPSAQLFDHCVVRLSLDGKVYWLDPTLSVQPSPLNMVTQCYYGWGLPLRDGVTALERMPDPEPQLLLETEESIVLGAAPSDPVKYEWRHRFRGVRAEALRTRIARDGAVSVLKHYSEDVQRVWPKAHVVKQEIVTDNVEANFIVVHESYDIHEAWALGDDGQYRFGTHDLIIRGTLARLDPGERKHDIYLGQPGRYARRVEVRTATTHQGGWRHSIAGSAIQFTDEMRIIDPHFLVMDQSLDLKALALPASEAETYRRIVQKLETNELLLIEKARNGKFIKASNQRESALSGAAFWFVIAIALLAIGGLGYVFYLAALEAARAP
jgi:hypothetical protein